MPLSLFHPHPPRHTQPPPPRRQYPPHTPGYPSETNRLLGAELGGAIGGAAFLFLVFIAFVYIRRRRARQYAARMPVRQEPFIVNPTWVLASPTSDGTQSHLSLPDRARPRTIPVAHQMSLPDLATQYRSTRVLRPRAYTVGADVLARTETRESDSGLPMRSESSVWRPRIDILGARQQRTDVLGTGQQPQRPMDSFWAT
ncbi:hypothetical protein DFH06DRAFT_1466040 [Mycena polygramma]|nr:hypothetical protein DFH06DRAFT_1466040 [Mycena polygramma]